MPNGLRISWVQLERRLQNSLVSSGVPGNFHRYRSIREGESCPILQVADDSPHRPVGVGYLCVPTVEEGYIYTKAYHTPGIPHTILSPASIAREKKLLVVNLCHNLDGGPSYVDFACSHDCSKNAAGPIRIDLHSIRDLTYTRALLKPEHMVSESSKAGTDCAVCSDSVAPSVGQNLPIHVLSQRQNSVLTHLRLAHVNNTKLRMAQQRGHITGLPAVERDDPLHKCEFCLASKLHKAPRGPTINRNLDEMMCLKDLRK